MQKKTNVTMNARFLQVYTHTRCTSAADVPENTGGRGAGECYPPAEGAKFSVRSMMAVVSAQNVNAPT
jgi:hypothetical protein